MSIREKHTIQIVASEAARRHYQEAKENHDPDDEYSKMRSPVDVRPYGEDWKQLKRELSYVDLSKPEESFFEEQLKREYRRLRRQDR